MKKKEKKPYSPIITELELSYTNSWWDRTLPTTSKEWKELRQVILVRDNYTCRFCSIRLSKYMICDHIDGDATNNSLSNLGLNCPACDTIRHCGLGEINGYLIAVQSILTQTQIVKMTHEFYLENKRIPSPKEIDGGCKVIEENFGCFNVANERFLYPKRREWLKWCKGFFTEEFKMDYLKYIIE